MTQGSKTLKADDLRQTTYTIEINITWTPENLDGYAPHWDDKTRVAFLKKYAQTFRATAVDAGWGVIQAFVGEETPETLAEE